MNKLIFYFNFYLRKTINIFLKKPIIKNTKESIDFIINNKISVTRFGDGEFDLILNNRSLGFQKKNNVISAKLSQILKTQDENIIVAIPYTLVSLRHCNDYAYDFWGLYWNRYYRKLKPHFDLNKTYYDSLFTRIYMDYKDKSNSANLFKQLFRVWESQNIVIVEGLYSKLGVGNDIFNNAKSIKRILCPPKNAFDFYDEILSIILEKTSNDDLILVSLGPTATILAYDLAQKGRWCIDIGHIDIEYEWMKIGATDKIKIENRKVWESTDDAEDIYIEDKDYENTIIAKVLTK